MSYSIPTYGRMLAVALGLTLMAAVPTLKANEIDNKVVMTFAAPVEIPGMVLPAGTYVFRALTDNPSIFQVIRSDDNTPVGMFSTVRDYRTHMPVKFSVRMEERKAGAPEALRSWAYPGDPYGFEFVYPVSKKPAARS